MVTPKKAADIDLRAKWGDEFGSLSTTKRKRYRLQKMDG